MYNHIMWNIRMRASKTGGIHISGAEGIFKKNEITEMVNGCIRRAFNHPRGMPDEIVITVEAIKRQPVRASLLPLAAYECNSADEARGIISAALSQLGVSRKALSSAFRVLRSKKTMRGASLIFAKSGRRAEPDRNRGIRVSRLGIDKISLRRIMRNLSKMRLNTTTVKEALTLASKVASCPDIAAEVCISDDPDYTTGYIASRKTGYVRIPNIKKNGEMHGGRVFFIREGADAGQVIKYLEKTPVILY